MTCETCGEKPKKCGNCNKDFPRAVIEINNPEKIALLRKVVIPASMGTEEEVPAAIGKYHNVILHYEANKHTYLYSSDGIPTLLEMEVSQEVLDRISELEEDLAQETTMREGMDEELQLNIDAVAQDLEDFKNSPDVVDIVPTYAALQAYDTSKLGDNDEIRVLTDETHDDASAYYRWDKTNSQWIFIGITGPYYTKSEIDSKIDVNRGLAHILTSEDYNWNSTSHSSVEPYDSVALWLLAPGMYIFENGVSGYVGERSPNNLWIPTNNKKLYQVSLPGTYGVLIIDWETNITTGGSPMGVARMYDVSRTSGGIARLGYLGAPIDNLSSNNADVPLSARQGKILNGIIGDLSALTTYQKGSIVNAINEINREGDYSDTIELDTETKWTNGDKIYKRTIQVASLPNNSSLVYSFGVSASTLGQVIKFEIIAHNQNTSTFIQVPDGIGISAEIGTAGVKVSTTSDYSGYSAYITVWYTKNS